MRILRQYLPQSSILVGQNIGKDVDWLQLKEGKDYQVQPNPFEVSLCVSFLSCCGLNFRLCIRSLSDLTYSACLGNIRHGHDNNLKTLAWAQSLVDLTGIYRVWNTKYNTWSVFGQDHLAKVLLGWKTENSSHDAVGDAVKSIRLFNLYKSLQSDPQAWRRAQV